MHHVAFFVRSIAIFIKPDNHIQPASKYSNLTILPTSHRNLCLWPFAIFSAAFVQIFVDEFKYSINDGQQQGVCT